MSMFPHDVPFFLSYAFVIINFLWAQVATIQGLSGTGSLRLAAALIERYFPGAKVLISAPTWGIRLLPLTQQNVTCVTLSHI